MKMVGHKTESVYRRYAIASDADLREAAAKLAAVSESVNPLTGTIMGTVSVIGRVRA